MVRATITGTGSGPRLATGLVAAMALVAGLVLPPARAQDPTAEEKSRIQRFVEDALSRPGRKVEIGTIDGLLSSTINVAGITISDADGPWLELEDLSVTWNRLALARMRLSIDEFRAGEVRLLRRPLPAPAPGEGKSGGGGLPLSVIIRSIELPAIAVSADAAGIDALLAATGAVTLTDDAYSAQIDASRLDGPGGNLKADFSFDPGSAALSVSARLSEPVGGLAASALGLAGTPALALDLDGSGRLDDWQADLRLAADGRPVLEGRTTIRKTEDGYRGLADIAARIGDLLPDDVRPFAEGEARLAADVTRRTGGAWMIDRLDYESARTRASARGQLTADRFPVTGQMSATLDGAGALIALPGSGSRIRLAGLAVDASLGGGEPAIWELRLGIDGLALPQASAGRIEAVASGQARDLADPDRRTSGFDLKAMVRQLVAVDPHLAELAGPEVALVAAGRLGPEGKAEITQSRLDAAALAARFDGTIGRHSADGTVQLSVNDLAGLAPLAGRELGGALAASARGSVRYDGGALDLIVEGRAENIRTGMAAADGLLAGLATFAGGVRRDGETLTVSGLRVESEGLSLAADGPVLPEADLRANGRIADLGRLAPKSSGAMTVEARFTGPPAAPHLALEARVGEARLAGKPVRDFVVGFEGHLAGEGTSGTARLSAILDGIEVTGGGDLHSLAGGMRRIDNIALASGPNRVTGALALDADNRIDGRLAIEAPDLSGLAPLFLLAAEGSLTGTVTLNADARGQAAAIDARARDIVAGPARVGAADIRVQVADLFGMPTVNGTFASEDVAAGGVILDTVNAQASRVGSENRFEVTGRGPDTGIDVSGAVRPASAGMTIALERAKLVHAGAALNLTAPADFAVADGQVRVDNAIFDAGGGRLRVFGTAGRTFDLIARMSSVPLSLAKGLAPDLGAEGRLSGQVHVSGARAAPKATFEGGIEDVSVAVTRARGLPTVDVSGLGAFAEREIRLDLQVGGVPDLALVVTGTVGTAAPGTLDLAVSGPVPMALARPALASRGASLSGSANLALAVEGTTATPVVSGSITGSGGRLADPATGVAVSDLVFDLGLDGDQVTVRQLTGRAGPAGSLNVTGTAGIAPGSGYPLDLAAQIRDGTYSDGDLVKTTFDADLTITGPALDGPRIAGNVQIGRTEITVPERRAVGASELDVRHREAPAAVRRTLALALPRARPRAAGSGTGLRGAGPELDITVDAPARIFVRGRGLDAELGGNIKLTGRPGALAAVGTFSLRRGRLDILNQRITLTRGTTGFQGDLDPVLDFVGTTGTNGYAITVTVTGRASDPKIAFSSSPALPEDEVLAQFLYGRAIDELSPVQLVQLAAAVAELGGLSSGPGLLGRLRETTGLDDLNVVTDDEGNPAVRAGRYVSDNVYLGVEQGSGSDSSRVTIDLDIGANIKARGSVGADGDSSVGIFYEREY